MKEKILTTTKELAITYGVKSVTMDDIANAVGCSKKTLYKFYSNKEELLFEVAKRFQAVLHQKVRDIMSEGLNAIEENFKIRKVFREFIHITDNSPMLQMRKYYPEVYHFVINNEKKTSYEFVENNLEKGIAQGLYREEINIENVKHYYFALFISMHENEDIINLADMEIDILSYHTRAIATPKGVVELENQLKQFYTS